MHVLYNPDGVVKYSVIHHLRLINSAQLLNKNSSQYVDHVMPLCLSLIMHALAGSVDPGIKLVWPYCTYIKIVCD